MTTAFAELDHTHDGQARSWLASANADGTDFPLQNLPFCVFREKGLAEGYRGGVGIGDQVLDLAALNRAGLLSGPAGTAAAAASGDALNPLLALGPQAWSALRHAIFELMHIDGIGRAEEIRPLLLPQTEAKYRLPVAIGGYTDFYTSIHHARNIGRLMGIDALPENFRWMPIAYHGRTSTIGISGQKFRRPLGQVLHGDVPALAATTELDYELELGIVIGQPSEAGRPLSVDEAEASIFGFTLLNDWSARDIQRWESFPLGPFQSKNTATTLSPWIVTAEALKPYRTASERSLGEPAPLPHLTSKSNATSGAIDIEMEVWLETEGHRAHGMPAERLSATSFRHQYWNVAQMVAHHAVGGCNLEAGDLLGSGTVSGPEPSEAGAMIELTLKGFAPVALTTGGTRSFVEDGDVIILRGHCERDGFARIGFGESRGQVLPAHVRHRSGPFD